MTPGYISLVVRKDTTSAEIAAFAQEAMLSRANAGVRAQHGVGADGKLDGTVVLYVRDLSTLAKELSGLELLIDNVKAFFNAKEEYRLATETLMERLEFAGFEEFTPVNDKILVANFTDALNGEQHLTIGNIKSGWQAAFPSEARMQSRKVLNAFRRNIAELKGLPIPNSRQKNGQAPRTVVEKGINELSYLSALLFAPFDTFGMSERRHVNALFGCLDLNRTDENAFDLHEQIASLVHVAGWQKSQPFPSEPTCASWKAEVAHIKTAIKFAQAWLKGRRTCSQNEDAMRYNHVKALDYLACSILRVYPPDDNSISDVQQFLAGIAVENPTTLYTSITQVMDAKFVKWLQGGNRAQEFFSEKDMQWRLADETE